MVDVRVRKPIAPGDIAAVRDVADAVEAVDGHPPFGDAVWRDLARPTPNSTLVLADAGGRTVGVAHLSPPETGDTSDRVAALAVHPEHRDPRVAKALLEALLAHVDTTEGSHVALWLFGTDTAAADTAIAAGFVLERELWQMRMPLPAREEPRWPSGAAVRVFAPGRDEGEWLEANNRAFVADPDQGGWSLATLQRREAEPWFDPAGFLLAFDAEGLAGFCWTKLHEARPPREPKMLGEIYVIGVDPDRQGTGLGRALTLAGLASLSERGAGIGMLFVDAANAAAVALYRDLGFVVTRVDRAYGRRL